MNTKKTLSAALTGTSAMTLFSYLVSRSREEQFREPVLLSILLKRLVSAKRYPDNTVSGWGLHYTVGTVFSLIYDRLWSKGALRPSFTNALLLGGVSGFVGVSGWHTVLKLHPDPPKIDMNKYYGHLLVAHIVFSVFAWGAYTKTRANSHFKELEESLDQHHAEK